MGSAGRDCPSVRRSRGAESQHVFRLQQRRQGLAEAGAESIHCASARSVGVAATRRPAALLKLSLVAFASGQRRILNPPLHARRDAGCAVASCWKAGRSFGRREISPRSYPPDQARFKRLCRRLDARALVGGAYRRRHSGGAGRRAVCNVRHSG